MLIVYNLRLSEIRDPRRNHLLKMTLPLNETSNVACQCSSKNCNDCKCGCGPECCSKDNPNECAFMKAHPNWQKCPFMSKMFMNMCPSSCQSTETAAKIDHSTCDASKCSNLPMTECTSCHKTPGLNHMVTLETDIEVATDQTEDMTM